MCHLSHDVQGKRRRPFLSLATQGTNGSGRMNGNPKGCQNSLAARFRKGIGPRRNQRDAQNSQVSAAGCPCRRTWSQAARQDCPAPLSRFGGRCQCRLAASRRRARLENHWAGRKARPEPLRRPGLWQRPEQGQREELMKSACVRPHSSSECCWSAAVSLSPRQKKLIPRTERCDA